MVQACWESSSMICGFQWTVVLGLGDCCCLRCCREVMVARKKVVALHMGAIRLLVTAREGG